MVAQALIINLKICYDLGNLGDIRIGARTGLMRTLRLILVKMNKNEKKKNNGGSEERGSSTQRHGLFPSQVPLQVREGVRTESLELC